MRWVVTLAVVSACYSPQPTPGAPCPDGVCPTGLVCSPATISCELTAADAATDTPRPGDAQLLDAYVPPTPVLRQQVINYSEATASLNASFATAPTSGNVLIMIGATPQAPLTSVSGGGVATWALAKRSTIQANVEIWYGITNGSSSTVTITLTNGTSPTWLHVSEWSALTGVVDAAALDGGSSPASAGSVTTTTRDLLVFGIAQFTPTTIGSLSPGTWSMLQPIDGNSVRQREWYRVESTPDSYAPTVTVSSGGWDAALVAFKIQN